MIWQDAIAHDMDVSLNMREIWGTMVKKKKKGSKKRMKEALE